MNKAAFLHSTDDLILRTSLINWKILIILSLLAGESSTASLCFSFARQLIRADLLVGILQLYEQQVFLSCRHKIPTECYFSKARFWDEGATLTPLKFLFHSIGTYDLTYSAPNTNKLRWQYYLNKSCLLLGKENARNSWTFNILN